MLPEASGQVAVYIRWSTDEQSEGTTLQVQREACEHYVCSQGWQFRTDLLFVDEGFSGGSLDRPGLAALRQAVLAGRVTCCVVYKLDRLSRSVIDTVNLILQEWEGRCHVRSTREPIDTTTPTGKIFFYMLASYAEWERSIIRERTLSGKAKRAQQGKNPGFTYPFGYRPGPRKGEWLIDEAEAAVVRRIFDEYTRGHGANTISERLNREGIRSRQGGRFHPARITHLIANPCYMGTLAYGRSTRLSPALRRREGRSVIHHAEPRYAVVEGALPAIVSPQQFARAQAVRESKAAVRGRRALSPQFLLSGIVRCRCGCHLSGHVGGNNQTRYYRCPNNRLGSPARCSGCLLPAERLEATVLEQVRQAFSPNQRERCRQDLAEAVQRRRSAATAALVAVSEALHALRRRRRRLDADYDAGDLPARLYASRTAELEAEAADLIDAQAAHQAALAELPAGGRDEQHCTEFSVTVDGWQHLDGEERKQALRHALARCVAYREPAARRHSKSGAPLELTLEIWRAPLAPDRERQL